MKRISYLVLAVLVVAGLLVTACGGTPTPAPPAPTKAPAAAEPTKAPAPAEPTKAPAAPAAKVKITFWYSIGGASGDALRAMADEFNKVQNAVEVEATYTGSYADTAQKVTAALETKTLPNSGLVAAAPLFTGRENNYKILDYVNGPDGLDKDDFWPVLWDYNVYGGKIASLPFNNSTPVMYYNKDLMTKAGLDPAKPPQTWDELKAQATTIKNKLATEGVIPINFDSPDWMLKAFILQNGGKIMNADATDVAFASPEGYEAMTYWKSLIDEKLMPPAQHKTVSDVFIAGKVAFLYSSTGNVGKVLLGAKFNWNTAFLPKNKKYAVTVGGAQLALFPSTPEKEKAAWTFLKWLLNKENVATWTAKTGYVPVRKSAMNSPALLKLFADQPQYKAGFEQLQYGETYPHFWEMGQMDATFVTIIEKMELGKASPKEALDEAAATMRKEMKK